jgi:hypothetical protein
MSKDELFRLILGKAGVGKMADNDPSIALAATTGVAAVNLGSGTTINTLLGGYFDTASLHDYYVTGKLAKVIEDLWYKRKVRRVVLDEGSVLPAEQLTIICQAITDFNKEGHSLGFTIVADMGQLPPVEGRYCFHSPFWAEFNRNKTVLTEVKRQTDKEFIEGLNLVRFGHGRDATPYFESVFHQHLDRNFEGTTLFSTNKNSDRFNTHRMNQLPGVPFVLNNHKWVKKGLLEPREWKHIPSSLTLKKNALVMLLTNKRREKSSEFLYVNGDLGYVRDFSSGALTIELMRGYEITITRLQRKEYDKGVGGYDVLVSFLDYFPAKIAFSSTIHKAEGLTLDNVQVDMRGMFFEKCPGLAYVALSRARAMSGLRLVGLPSAFHRKVKVSPEVLPWL